MTPAERRTVDRLTKNLSDKCSELKKLGATKIDFKRILEQVVSPEVPADELQWYRSAVAREFRIRKNLGKRETSSRINPNFLNRHFSGLPRGDRD